jgi:hypothetical protein
MAPTLLLSQLTHDEQEQQHREQLIAPWPARLQQQMVYLRGSDAGSG